MVTDGGEGFLVHGDLSAVPAAEGACCGGAAAQGRGGAGAAELGGGQPGPGFLDDQARGAGAQHRAGRPVPRAGDRGLVFPERGFPTRSTWSGMPSGPRPQARPGGPGGW